MHIFLVMLPDSADREHIIAVLRAEGIHTSLHYPPIHHLSWHRDRIPDVWLPVTGVFPTRELTLPLHPKMEDWQIERVTQTLRRSLAH